MTAKKPEPPPVFVGYRLSPSEAQALLDYLAERPFKEVFQIVGLVTANPIYEPGK